MVSRKENLSSYLFLAPFLIIFGLFLMFPIVYSLYLSFMEQGPGYSLSGMVWVGFDNYIRLAKDPEFWWALLMTLYYSALIIPGGIFTALMLAILLNNQLPFKTFFRSAFFLPNVLDMLVVGIIWTFIYAKDGVLDVLLDKIGIALETSLLGNPYTAMPAVILALILKGAGFGMVLFLAAIQNIDKSIYEAADIDGANPVHKFFHITLPLVKPIILFMVITGVIGSLNAFTEVYAMTKGGPTINVGGNPLGVTKLTGYYLFSKWESCEYGYAAAISFVILFITLAISAVNIKFLSSREA